MKPSKVADEIIGMLNADGGVLVLGISDSGDIQDLNALNDKQRRGYESLVNEFIKPPSKVQLEKITLPDGKLIYLYHVDHDCERVFSRVDNEKIFLRVSDQNKELNRDDVRKLEYDKSIRTFEDEFRREFDPDDFRNQVLDYYKKKLNYDGNIEDLLIKRNLAVRDRGDILYRNSAILLFAEDPEKYIPSAFVRYIRYDGIDAKSGTQHNVVKDERFHEGIPRMIEILKKFVYATLKDYFYLDMEEGKFVKISEYPQEAWLEGVVNALCHRSYNIQGNSIYIKHFDDRLEISNSGPLPAQVTIENIKTERFSRNPRIARVLSDLGYVRELNEGVSRIYESMERSMLAKPEYQDKNNTITLALRNKVADHEKSIEEEVMRKVEKEWKNLNTTERKILQILFMKNKVKISELVREIEVSNQAIRGYLNGFCEKNILERHSTLIRDKNAIYTFKKS